MNYAQDPAQKPSRSEPAPTGAWWYAGFVGGRAEADELRARPLFVPIAGGRGELCSNPARAYRGRHPLLRGRGGTLVL
jgi:hypothetical protein